MSSAELSNYQKVDVVPANDLTKFIDSHFLNGIPATELTTSERARKRLNDLFSLYDMYNENPCMDVAQCLKWKFKHSPTMIAEDMVYFEYIRSRYVRMTRQRAKDLVNWASEKVMRDAAAVNDRKGMLDAAKVLTRANQLDKPEPEVEDKRILPQPMVYTPFVEVLDPDRQTIKDKKLLSIMREWNAHIDEHDEKIQQKVEAMRSSSDTTIKSIFTTKDGEDSIDGEKGE